MLKEQDARFSQKVDKRSNEQKIESNANRMNRQGMKCNFFVSSNQMSAMAEKAIDPKMNKKRNDLIFDTNLSTCICPRIHPITKNSRSL